MEHIIEKEHTFLINTENTSYMLMVNAHGHIEQLHYGAPVEIEDAEALRYKRTMPYGSEVLYTQADEIYCLDNVPLNWSGIGKGDFRQTPLEVQMPDGSLHTCRHYLDGIVMWDSSDTDDATQACRVVGVERMDGGAGK